MKILVALISVCLSACASMGLNAPPTTEIVEFTDPPAIGTTAAGQEIHLGGFSGLVFHRKTADNHFRFYTITDRGPNTKHKEAPEGSLRPFLLPSYTPRILEVDVDFEGKKVSIVKEIPLRTENGDSMNGLPTDTEQEIPLDLKGARLTTSRRGLDSEALVHMPQGTFWVAEEYEPSILNFYSNGKLIRRYSPANGMLPTIFAKRQMNAGFEGLAYANGMLYAFLQGPVTGATHTIRVLEFDPWRKKAKRQFLYVLAKEGNLIGDAVATRNGKIYVIERDRDSGAGSFKRVYEISFDGATDISKLGNVEEKPLDGISPVGKSAVLDLVANGFTRWEKSEGLAMIDDHTLAVVTDNDFGLDGSLDMETGKAGTKDETTAFLLFAY